MLRLSIVFGYADKGSEYQGTGSRFQHAEKLQFALEDDGPQVEEATEEVSHPSCI